MYPKITSTKFDHAETGQTTADLKARSSRRIYRPAALWRT
jgi:hypothetical protein